MKLYPGGYPANFGRFAGGIVTANAAEPKNEWRGAAGLRVFDVGGMVEAPFANGRGNVMAGGRYSYSTAAFSLFSPGLDIGYWDYQARAAYDISPDDRLSVLAFGAFDFASEENDDGTVRPLYDVTFHRLDVRYDHRFSSTRRLRLAATTGADRTLADDQSLGERKTFDIDARLHDARAEYVDRLAENVELRASADLISEKSEVVMPLGYGGDVPYAPPQDQFTLGARSDVVWGIANFLTLVPGVRFDVYRTRRSSRFPVQRSRSWNLASRRAFA